MSYEDKRDNSGHLNVYCVQKIKSDVSFRYDFVVPLIHLVNLILGYKVY